MPHLPDHVTHDPELIAAYAAGDATGTALDQAADLVAACTECADLHRDLRAISTALPELPAPVRPRDFRLTPEQAASLRPVGWRGVLAAFAAPRFRLAAPLGAGLAAAGLAGLLLASPGALLPGAASGEATTGSAPSLAAAPAAPGDQPSAAAGAAAVGAQPAEGASTDPERLYLGVDAAKASAAASAGLAPLPQPGAFAPDASAPAASALPDTITALGTAPVAGVVGSGNQAAPSAAASTSADQRAQDAAREPAQAGPTAAAPEAAVSAANGTPAIPVVASILLVVGLTLIVLRVAARRLV